MKRALRFIPKKLRHLLYRKAAAADFDTTKAIVFKIAESQEELEQAFRLIYKVHLEKNLVMPTSSEMKISKIHAMPTTKVLIAVDQKQVVSVLCMSLEGPLRTSCEEHFDLNLLKAQNKCFVEISNFVVESNYAKDFKSFLFPLCKLGITLNKTFFKADYLVTAVPSEDFDYWSSLFLFGKFSERTVKFQDFHSKTAVCAFADVHQLEEKFLKRYARKKSENNLYQYLFVRTDSRLQVPQISDILKQKYSPQILNYFFNIKTNVFAHLTSFESRTLQKIYEESEYDEVLPAHPRTKFENHRNSKRYHAHLTARLSQDNSEAVTVTVKTVSMRGVGAICSRKLSTEATYQMRVDVGDKTQIDLLVSPVWSSRDQTYGFVIRNQSPDWIAFIENFYTQEKLAS